MTFKIVYFRVWTSHFITHKCFWKYVESGIKIADKKAWNKRRLKNYIMSPWEMLQLPTIYCYMSFLISPRIDEAQDRKKFTRKRNEINLDILNQLQCIEKTFSTFYWNSMLWNLTRSSAFLNEKFVRQYSK